MHIHADHNDILLTDKMITLPKNLRGEMKTTFLINHKSMPWSKRLVIRGFVGVQTGICKVTALKTVHEPTKALRER